ncbi:MAG TPA: hypothetical protein VF032_02595 [Thermoleophilaceae bacterium]
MLDFFGISLASRAVSDQFSPQRSDPEPRRRHMRVLLDRLRASLGADVSRS